jgi:hypothetical protein
VFSSVSPGQFQSAPQLGYDHILPNHFQYVLPFDSILSLGLYALSVAKYPTTPWPSADETRGEIEFYCWGVNLSYPCNWPRRPTWLRDVEAPTFSLENRLTDGGKVVRLTRRSPFTPQKYSWYSFLLEAESLHYLVYVISGKVCRTGRESDRVNYCWSSPAQSFFVPSPAGIMVIFYRSRNLGFMSSSRILHIFILYEERNHD